MTKIKLGSKKDSDLKIIKDLTAEMFDQVDKMLSMSIQLLENSSNEMAMKLIEEDTYVDDLQNDIIVEVNNFIIVHQPNARDLREALGVYQLISDLERIGDHCKTFAKTLIKSDIEERKHQKLIDKILSALDTRLKETKEAYLSTNHQLAKSIAKRDFEIDDLTNDLIRDSNNKLLEVNKKEEVKSFTKIILMAKNFERSGDHLVNICEQISYIKKGQLYHYA